MELTGHLLFGGLLNALYFIPIMLRNKNRANMNIVAEGNLLPTVKEFFNMIFTFFLTINVLGYFRSNSVHESILYLKICIHQLFIKVQILYHYF